MADPVVLDFDGVVLDSVDVKTTSFAALFEKEGPAVVEKVVAHHLANGGLSRFEKFRWIYREVLKRELTGAEEKRLGDEFNRLVEHRVLNAAFIPGAMEFLEREHEKRALYVASGTPEEELRRIVERRGLSRFFKGVYGSPKTKDVLLKEIAAKEGVPVAALTMVGDSQNDLDAAAKAGCAFVGVGANFTNGTVVIPDLTSLSRLVAHPKESPLG